MTSTELSGSPAAPASRRTVLAISGSLRRASWNGRLMRIVAADIEAHGVAVAEHSLREHPLPIYDPDEEAETGVPAAVVALRALISRCDGMLIACPEYNGSVTSVLKNALDWSSRPVAGESALAPFQLKPVLIVGTSISPFGAVRAIGHLRAILGKMGALVMPEDLAVPNAGVAFTDDGFAHAATGAAAARATGAFAAQLMK